MILQRTFLSIALLCSFLFVSQAQQGNNKIDISYDDVKSVILKGSFCNVFVEGTSTSNLSLSGEITGKGSDNFSIEQRYENGKLEVWVKSHKKNNWGWNMNLKGTFNLKVPKSVALTVNNSSGNINAEHIQSSKTVMFRCSSGNINATDITANLETVASSGNIDLEKITGNTNVKTSSGNQSITRVEGKLTSIASSGDTRFSDVQGAIDAITSSGDIHLTNTHGACKLKASSGDIKGKGVQLIDQASIRTTSGSVTIDFSNKIDDLSFELTASSGSLRVAGEKSEKRLLRKSGAIQVRGISSSGDQTYD